LNNADGIIAIGEGVFKNLLPIPSTTKKCTIPNGFDEEDFVGKERKKHEHFVISHFGSINKTRNPEGIWRALIKINSEHPEIGKQIQVKLYGKVDFQVGQGIASLIDSGQVVIIDYLPHDQMIDELLYADLLLLMINRIENADRITTGKIFEYIGSGQDIIGLGPVIGDAASILEKADAGKMYDWDDVDGINDHILQSIKNSKTLSSTLTKERLKYSRKELTADLVSFLTSI
jgi:glycosyltransferase involved in cell wall biosynthesis